MRKLPVFCSLDITGIQVFIGTEDDSGVMSDTTLIFKNVSIGGKRVAIGVIGPKRMDYQKVILMINRLAYGMGRMFGEGGFNLLTSSDDDT